MNLETNLSLSCMQLSEMSVSSLISWTLTTSIFSLISTMNFFNLYFYSISSLDSLSNSMSWLTGGILVMSLLASEKSKFSVKLWWGLAVVLFISFYSLTLFKFYIFFELSLIPILLMIVSLGSQPERLSAGAYLLFYTTVISIPYLVILLFMKHEYSSIWTNKLMKGATLMSIIILMPFLVKMPVFGIHFWLPKAHVEANTSGSMVLAGLLLKLGSYGAFRASSIVMLSKNITWYASIWMMLAIFSGVLTSMQSDVKKLVAYSSVTHMTFLLVAIATNSKVMWVSVIMLSLSHGWTASGMFNVAGTLSHASNSRMIHLMSTESSLNWMMLLFGVMLVANASVPPLPSFFPEVMMVMNLLTSSPFIIFLFIFLSILVCYYNAFSFILISHTKPMSVLIGLVKFISGLCVFMLVSSSLVTLFWMAFF